MAKGSVTLMAAADCPFCKRIAAGEYESFDDDPDVVWFEPLNPVTPGHLLFVPAAHVASALEDPYTTAITMGVASRRAATLRAIALPDEWACNLITSAGAAATQTVQHLHVHLVPRHPGDGLHLPWTRQREGLVTVSREDLRAVLARGSFSADAIQAADRLAATMAGTLPLVPCTCPDDCDLEH